MNLPSLCSHLPNLITIGRLIISIALFVLLSRIEEPNIILPELWSGAQARTILFNVSWFIFLVAVLSDILDGYLARKWRSTSAFGRFADPLVDKVIICGTFVFFASIEGSERLVAAWMVVLIMGREFLVTGLRSLRESQGKPSPSNRWGKSKMFIQCLALSALFCYHANCEGEKWAYAMTQILLWSALAITFISGMVYLYDATMTGRKIARMII